MAICAGENGPRAIPGPDDSFGNRLAYERAQARAVSRFRMVRCVRCGRMALAWVREHDGHLLFVRMLPHRSERKTMIETEEIRIRRNQLERDAATVCEMCADPDCEPLVATGRAELLGQRGDKRWRHKRVERATGRVLFPAECHAAAMRLKLEKEIMQSTGPKNRGLS